MFTIIFVQPLANGLILFYRLLGGNLGMAIIFFSFLLRLVLNPLTRPYINSMKKMREIAPHLEKIKKKFKNDKIKMAQAQAELYRQHKINPGAGFLPFILQIVIFIAFFRVFSLTLYGGGDITMKFNKLLYSPLKFSQDEIVNTRFLYLDVSQPDVFRFSALPFPFPGPLVILAAFVQFLNSKLSLPMDNAYKKVSKKTKEKTDDVQATIQQSMTYSVPFMTLFFGVSFPSGLVLYWLLFSLMQLVQQYRSYKGQSIFIPLFSLSGLLKLQNKDNKKDERGYSNN